MASLPVELLTAIFDEYANNLSVLHACTLVNRNWCAVALQDLWAKPFTLLLSSQEEQSSMNRVDNLITTFLECFSDVNSHEKLLCKKYSKKFPLDYSLYLKKIDFSEILKLTSESGICNNDSARLKIIYLAINHCPNLERLSLTELPYDQSQFLDSVESLPNLRILRLDLNLDAKIFSTFAKIAHNLKIISVGVQKKEMEFKLHDDHNHELQTLIQSQHQLKAFAMKNIIVKMRSVFILLESQLDSLKLLHLEDIDIGCVSDDFNIKPIKFHQLASIQLKSCQIETGGLKPIFEADLPKLQQLELAYTRWDCKSDWTSLHQKYKNQIVDSGVNVVGNAFYFH